MGMKSLSLALTLVLFGFCELTAQVRGTVTDRSSVGVSGVWVEAWGSDARLGATLTNESGAFSLESVDPGEIVRISFSHVGYETVVMDLDRAAGSLRVVLDRRTISLPELTVVVAEQRCPTADDPTARGIWRSASRRYSDDTGDRGQAAWILSTTGDVMEYDIGRYSADELGGGVHQWVGAPLRSRSLQSIISREGYAWKREGSTTGRRALNWVYPQLEGRHAYHFADELFGALHDFAFLSAGEDVHIIAFCPREQDTPSISGVLRISSDTTLLEARWRFHTPEPVEDAGAEVVFASLPDSNSDHPHLMAARGMFWRHDGREPPFPNSPRSYFQIIQVRTNWAVGPDAEIPPAPVRYGRGHPKGH